MHDPWNTLEDLTLVGQRVDLVPLAETHVPALAEVACRHPEIWAFTSTGIRSAQDAEAEVRAALQQRDRGEARPFAILSRGDGSFLGSTRLYQMSRANRNLEIGYTWLTPSVWRTAVNTECKFLLLRHAFEELRCVRVALRTDRRNLRSQAAIERLGAKKEGVLRKHMILADGYVRDTVYYGIVDEEWAEVKAGLIAKMGHKWGFA